jgi:hypothetical protein
MATVKLVDEDDPNPLIQEVFRDIKETKKIDFIPNICAPWPRTRSTYLSAGRS